MMVGRTFLMEYVDGLPIDRYCDERRLTIEQRLRIFLDVCAALSHAHQRLVVHRDIKPTNILVTPEGLPKLLDFGIAKVMHASSAGETRATAAMFRPMTPEYASPEQVQGLASTTLGDVYSLGVVLYELLGGRPPFRFTTRTPVEIARVITTLDPPRPSEALTRSSPAGELGDERTSSKDISGARATTVARLRSRLQGDLDTIVLKALRRDRERRYQSVEQLADDIRRHMGGLPILARQDAALYRAVKFVRRHKVAVASGVLLSVSMTAGLVGTVWQARRARVQQVRAEKRFQDVRTLAHAVVFDYHDAIRNLPGSTAVRERLVKDALSYLDSLATEAGEDVALLRELGLSYQRLGDVQGWPGGNNLGDTKGALTTFEKSAQMLGTLGVLAPDVVDDRIALAQTHDHWGQTLWALGDPRGSLKHRRIGLELMEQLGVDHPNHETVQLVIADFTSNLGRALEEQGDVAGALEQHLRAKQRFESLLAGDPSNVRARRGLSAVEGQLGSVYGRRGEHETALKSIRAQLAILRDLGKEFPQDVVFRRDIGVVSFYEGDALSRSGRPQDALESYQRYLVSSEALSQADPRNVQFVRAQAFALVRIADSLLALGRAKEATALLPRAVKIWLAHAQADAGNVVVRVGLIRARAKLAKALALAEGSVAAVTEGEAASALMAQYPAESVNADLLGIYSDVYIELGDSFTQPSRRMEAPPPPRVLIDGARRAACINAASISCSTCNDASCWMPRT